MQPILEHLQMPQEKYPGDIEINIQYSFLGFHISRKSQDTKLGFKTDVARSV